MKINCLTCSHGNHDCTKRDTRLENIECDNYRQVRYETIPIKLKNGNTSYRFIEFEN